MRASLRGLAAALLALALGSGCAPAQTYVVEKIAFTGSDLSQTELLGFTGLKPGGPVERDGMQAASDRLTGTGLFASVKFSFDGQTLTYELQPSPGVVPVQYDNFPWWDDKTLNTLVAARVPLFHGALYPGGAMREEVTAALVSLLASKDVRGATISTAPVSDADGTQTAIRYHIDTPPIVIASFHMEGYGGVWTQPLQAVERAAFGKKFDGPVRDELASQVRAVYGHLGFIDMQMTGLAWGRPLVVNGEVAVPVTASITSEGGQYHVSGIHLNGDLFMTPEQFAQRAALHPGDVANTELWTQVREMVQAPYRSHGYLNAKIDAEPALDRAQHMVDYTVTVTPGAQYHMGRLTLVNLDDRQKAELKPYWQLHAGDVFNPEVIGKSIGDYQRERAVELQSIQSRSGNIPYSAKWTADVVTHVVDVVVTFEPERN